VATGSVIQAANLGLAAPVEVQPEGAPLASLEEVEKRHIPFVLQQLEGNVTQAARTLGIDRATLYNKIKKYGLCEPQGS
jgi:transcriptional regulator of acetoin/glycerol metabolism